MCGGHVAGRIRDLLDELQKAEECFLHLPFRSMVRTLPVQIGHRYRGFCLPAIVVGHPVGLEPRWGRGIHTVPGVVVLG